MQLFRSGEQCRSVSCAALLSLSISCWHSDGVYLSRCVAQLYGRGRDSCPRIIFGSCLGLPFLSTHDVVYHYPNPISSFLVDTLSNHPVSQRRPSKTSEMKLIARIDQELDACYHSACTRSVVSRTRAYKSIQWSRLGSVNKSKSRFRCRHEWCCLGAHRFRSPESALPLTTLA